MMMIRFAAAANSRGAPIKQVFFTTRHSSSSVARFLLASPSLLESLQAARPLLLSVPNRSSGGGCFAAQTSTMQLCMLSTTSSAPSSNNKEQQAKPTDDAVAAPSASSPTDTPLVYESPLGAVVHKLRSVSLLTGIVGSVGVPCMIAIKGVIPASGMLIMAMAFVSGTMGSTAAIHYVFSPYVYRIESIPVRQCSSNTKDNDKETALSNSTSTSQSNNNNNNNHDNKEHDAFLLKAVTRSLFLRQVDVVFDPERDVTPYQGMKPLCNFQAKGIPLYVHAEYLYDDKLRQAINLDDDAAKAPMQKENPDDLL